MRVTTKTILRYDFERKTRERANLVEQLELASREIERITSAIDRIDVELSDISNEFDALTGYDDDGGVQSSPVNR